MAKQRVVRLFGAALLVIVGIRGLFSPLAQLALVRSMPDCIGVGPMTASVGMELRILSAVPDCPQGSYAPAASFHMVTHAAFTISVAALLIGIALLLLAIGIGFSFRQVVRQLRHWVSRRFQRAVIEPARLVIQFGRPVMEPIVVQPVRLASRPAVRRGPPSCSC